MLPPARIYSVFPARSGPGAHLVRVATVIAARQVNEGPGIALAQVIVKVSTHTTICKQFRHLGWVLASIVTAWVMPQATTAAVVEVAPVSAIGFQDADSHDLTTACGGERQQQDALADVSAVDGVFSPQAEGCILFNCYATGSSTHFLDAISLRFSVPAVSRYSTQPLRLRIHLQKGPYTHTWHALRVLPGVFNQDGADCDQAGACWSSADEFPSSEGWTGVVVRDISPEWVNGTELGITVRLWNARIDAITLAIPAEDESTTFAAVGFENDGCDAQDYTAELTSLDGVFAPTVGACVTTNYFATGTSAGYLDAVALRFDLSDFIPLNPTTDLRFRAYLRKGDYWNASWHAARLYPGWMSTVDQDCDQPECWSLADLFPSTPGWQGWIEVNVPSQWVSLSGVLSVTLRIWNASIDTAEIVPGLPTSAHPTSWGALKARYR